MMKRYIIILTTLFVCTTLFAQGEMDAINLSSSDLIGTARGQAMGGAFGALGGDVTGILINPAGLGVYRSSEINLTMGLNSVNMKTDWQNEVNRKNTMRLVFDNVSYVGYYPLGYKNFPVLNFSFSYNRLKDFNRRYSASGQGMASSLTDYLAVITNGIKLRDLYEEKGLYDPYSNWKIPWLSVLGRQGGLFDPVENIDSNDAYTSILFENEKVNPHLEMNERGYIESYDFSLGGNFGDKFYWGATFSLTDLFYHLGSSYTEEFGQREKIGLDNYLESKGSGYQFKLGAIVRPFDFLRLGVAYHSPTYYNLTDWYQGVTTAVYTPDYLNQSVRTPDNSLTYYRFNTPQNWVFSLAGVISDKAIISFDYELKDYNNMKMMDTEERPKEDTNGFIVKDFKWASTLRAGLELRFTPQFSGRLGYACVQNPYEKTFKDKDGGKEVQIIGTIPHYIIGGDVNYYTAGFGYRFASHFYVDVAFVVRTQKEDLYYYPKLFNNQGKPLVESTPASVTNSTFKGLVTVGYKF